MLSRARKGTTGLSLELVERTWKLWKIYRRERPAVMTGVGGTFIAPFGKLTNVPVVIFTDTEHAKVSNAFAFPLATAVCTPDCYEKQVGPKQITYPGYHELAYLHPDRFTPDPSQLERFGVRVGEPYIIMRLVSWASGHDFGDSGFTDLKGAVERLSRHGKVLISSENPLPEDLIPHAITASPEQIHHLLAFAALLIGESATMASESAILGNPAIFVSTSTRGYTNEQEHKYDLVFTFSDPVRGQESALVKAEAIFSDPEFKRKWQAKRKRMLADKMDVTRFVVDTVSRYGLDNLREKHWTQRSSQASTRELAKQHETGSSELQDRRAHSRSGSEAAAAGRDGTCKKPTLPHQ
jgi:predicted glycosyltransferase